MAEAFDRIMRTGIEALRSGSHGMEVAPMQSGRWGPSVVLRPSGAVARRLDELSTEVAGVAGPGHWLSGRVGYAHLTVRALERYQTTETVHERLEPYAAALARSVPAEPLAVDFSGVVLSSTAVMVPGRALGPGPDLLRDRFGEELGRDGWLEDRAFANGRDPIWYCSILHFAAPVGEPERLIDWVADRREVGVGEGAFDAVDICRWDHDGRAMAPTVLRTLRAAPSLRS